MRIVPIVPALLLSFAAAACAPADADSARQSRAPAATVVGEGLNCIQSTNIQNTRVWDDYTIDFHMRNGDVYRNTLPNRCPQLGFEERFAYKTSISQLCGTDIITVLFSDGQRGPSCGLGKFVPVEVEKR